MVYLPRKKFTQDLYPVKKNIFNEVEVKEKYFLRQTNTERIH